MYSSSEVKACLSSISNHLIHENDSHCSITLPSAYECSHNGLPPSEDTCTIRADTIMNISCPEN